MRSLPCFAITSRPKTGPKMTTSERAYIAIAIYPHNCRDPFFAKIWRTFKKTAEKVTNQLKGFVSNFQENWPEMEVPACVSALAAFAIFDKIRQKVAKREKGSFPNYREIGQKWKFLRGIPRTHHSGFRKNLTEANVANITTSSLLLRISSTLPWWTAPPWWIGFSFCFLLENGWSGVGRARTQ